MLSTCLNPILNYAEHIFRYFSSRKKQDGGFSQTPRLPATIEDTCYAASSLHVMKASGVTVPPELFHGHEAFLLSRLRPKESDPRRVFQTLKSLKLLDIPTGDHIKNTLHKVLSSTPTARDLYHLFYWKRLIHVVTGEKKEMSTTSITCDDKARLEKAIRTIKDLRMYVYLFNDLLTEKERHKWSRWILACQNGDGSLGFMPGTTSYMENCYYGVRCLEILGNKNTSLDIDGIMGFVMAAKSGMGGFGRKHLGIPFPSSTWHAIGTLHYLSLV